MAFQIKRFIDITASMVNLFRTRQTRVTDFNVGSVNRTMLEAVAMELDEAYQQMVAGLLAAVPISVFRSFDFPQLLAVAGAGQVLLKVTPAASALLIPAGTVLRQAANAATFSVLADSTVAAGNSQVYLPVVATVAGAASNVPANTAWTFDNTPASFVSASNPVAVANGRDTESAAEWKARFGAFVQTLARATPGALRYASQDLAAVRDSSGNIIERARFTAVDEPYTRDDTQPYALVNVYIHNGTGGTSAALVAAAQKVVSGYYDAAGSPVSGYKAAGIPCTVYPATEQAVNLTGVLVTDSTVDHAATCAAAVSLVSTYLAALPIAGPALAAVVTALVMSLPGVVNFDLAAGSSVDVMAAYNVKLMPGTLAFT